MNHQLDVNHAVYDLACLSDNLTEVRKILQPDIDIIAALKGNAYGHGAVPVAQRLAEDGVKTIMTGSFAEASAIGKAGIAVSIVMFAMSPPDRIGEIVNAGFTPTIVDETGARAAASTSEGTADVFVKIDMGLGRIGVPAHAAELFLEAVAAMPGIRVKGLYTHLPFATLAAQAWAKERYAVFDNILAQLKQKGLLPAVTQAGASSSVAAGVNNRANSVCIGHLLFGLSPFSEEGVANLCNLKPVFQSLRSMLVQVIDKPAGSDIAIAGMHGIPVGKRIGVAPIGMAHGLRQPPKESRAVALVGGRKVPVLAVSLEHLTMDLDSVPHARSGDGVVLLGNQGIQKITLEQMAGGFGLTCLEMVTAIDGRVCSHHTNARSRGSRSID